jgi:hypothetical protein
MGVRAACIGIWISAWAGLRRIGAAIAAAGADRIRRQWHMQDRLEEDDQS